MKIGGLRAVFGETYPDPVRVLSVGPEVDKMLAALFLKNPAGWDVGMEFGDVGCVRISFAINSNPFSHHFH